MRPWYILLAFPWPLIMSGQEAPRLPEEFQQQAVEGILDNLASEAGGEILPEWLVPLEDFLGNPLDINVAQSSDLELFLFLTPPDIDAILRHRMAYGPFLHVLELQVVEGLDKSMVKRLLPFIRAGDASQSRLRRSHWWSIGRKEVTLRLERTLQLAKGYQTQGQEPPPFEGNPLRLVGRLRYYSGNRVSYGISFEKDAGESIFRGSNAQGFDFISAHLSLQEPWKGCSRLIIGDFGVNAGQGLMISTGFQAGKGPMITQIRRNSRRFFPQNSWQESRFFRGAAMEWRLSRAWTGWTFASLRNRDGNTIQPDTLELDDIISVTSFQHSGLHRTSAEREDEGSIREIATGGGLEWKGGPWKMGLNGTWFSYNPAYQPPLEPYNQGFFRGRSLLAGSMDFDYSFRGNQWFGEVACSENGGWAATTGLLSSPDRHLQVALLARHFTSDHWNLWGAPIAENAIARNESGIYAGLVLRPVFGWKLSAYADVWRTPWLTFRDDSPARATEQLIRLDHEKRRHWNFYLQFRRRGPLSDPEVQPTNAPSGIRSRQQLRAQLQYDLHRILSLRTRLEWCRASTAKGPQDGYLLAQDILYHPVGSRWSGTMRYALFHTGGYDSRIYMFENDLLYSFSMRPYYHQGQRFYVNLRFSPLNSLTLEARYELYRLFNQPTIGSGEDEIGGSLRSGIKFQVRLLL